MLKKPVTLQKIAPTQLTHSYGVAVLFGLIATLIWGSSLVIIKIGYAYGGPVTSAGFRFVLAFLILLPFLRGRLDGLGGPSVKRTWLFLFATAFLGYTLFQWCAYAAVALIPASMAAFLMSFSPLFVVLFGVIVLRELPTPFQCFGFFVAAIGVYIFFSLPINFDITQGVALGVMSAVTLALFNIFSRYFARRQSLGTVSLTAIPLGIGGVSLLLIGIVIEGLPTITWQFIAVAAWLAGVNSVLGYVLWNRALTRLKAYELNIFWGLVPVETAILDWGIRGTPLQAHQVVGMLILVVGALLVQYRGRIGQLRISFHKR